MPNIHAVIMAGGAGTRFWPKSRTTTPKQLLALHTDQTLLAETVGRLEHLCPPERVWVITGIDQHQATLAALPMLPPENIVAEPARRDTAACIGLAATLVEQRDPGAMMVVLPADHIITPSEAFCQTLERACAAAGDEALATIGITPTHPATGYGYIERGATLDAHSAEVARFVEKPDLERAEEFLAAGRYAWNSGIFAFSARRILAEMAAHLPAHAARLEAIGQALGSAEYPAVLEAEFSALEKISIDYGVFERAERIVVVEADFSWDDVGSWAALDRHIEHDADGNVARAKMVSVDSGNSIIWSDDPEHLIGLVGVHDLIVVHTADATLICPRSEAERVKQLVQRCREEGFDKWLD